MPVYRRTVPTAFQKASKRANRHGGLASIIEHTFDDKGASLTFLETPSGPAPSGLSFAFRGSRTRL
jgi:hypothetical protein